MARVIRKGKGLERVRVAAKELAKLKAFVGWLESAKYGDGIPVAGVAATQEYGTDTIPPRSFIRTTMADKKDQWLKLLEQGAKAILAGRETADSVMEKLGLLAAGQVKTAISEVTEPPLKEKTIENRQRKRSDRNTVGSLDKPLIDTGVMIATITHEVQS